MDSNEQKDFYSTILVKVQAYAPTNDAMDEEKDEFYNQLQDTVSGCNRNDMIVVMGDLNNKVGNNNTNREEVMEKFGVGVMNDNGERLCDFCSVNGLIITGTIFPHKDIHKLTWRSPDGRTVNQINPCFTEWKHENIMVMKEHQSNERRTYIVTITL